MQALSATLHKSVEDQVGTGVDDGGDQAVKEPANVNSVTAATGDETPSRTYSTTSKAKIALQVVPIEVLSKEGTSVSTYALLDTSSEEPFLSKSITEKPGIQIDNYDTLAVCTLSGESAERVGQVAIGVRAAGNSESRTVIIKNVKVIIIMIFIQGAHSPWRFSVGPWEGCRQSQHFCNKAEGFIKMAPFKRHCIS